MLNVNSRKCISRLSGRTIKKDKTRNNIAILAIILTAVMFTTLLTIGASIIDSLQLSTMRQVGTKAHGGFKFLTQEQYDIVKADPKIKDISYNVIIGFGENPEFSKKSVEIRYTEEKAAEWGFSMPPQEHFRKIVLILQPLQKCLICSDCLMSLGYRSPLNLPRQAV